MRIQLTITLLLVGCSPNTLTNGDDLGAGGDLSIPSGSCSDTTLNCGGGGACTPCPAGGVCLHAADCVSGECTNNACVGPLDLSVSLPDLAVPQDLAVPGDLAPAMWQLQATVSNALYNGVWGSAANDVYVVGIDTSAAQLSPLVIHSTGSGAAWTTQTLPPLGPGAQLNAVWGSSANDVYAVGAATSDASTSYALILHSTGNGTWTIQDAGGSTPGLSGVWGSGSSDVYAVGYSNTILHSTGNGVWTPITSTVNPQGYYGIWGSGPNDIYLAAAGLTTDPYTGGYGLFHFTGSGDPTQAHGQSSATSNFDPGVQGVWGSSSTDVYDVGQEGWVGHVSGGTWGSAGNPIGDNPSFAASPAYYAVGGCSANDVYAVGYGWSYPSPNNSADIILHRISGSWQIDWFGDSNNFTTHNAYTLFGVWCSPTTGEVYAVGGGGGTGIIRYRP
jgi:hypothetical protein